MYPIPGHVSLSLLFHRYFGAGLAAVIVGAMMPDLIDKPLNDVFHLTPYGRYAMHSLFGMFVAGGAVYWWFGKEIGYSYLLGHFSHLLGDADFNPWFWPFVSYDWPEGIDVLDLFRQPGVIFFPTWILMETLLLGMVLFLYTRYAQKKSIQTAVLAAIVGLSIYRISRDRKTYLSTGAP